MRQPLTSIGVQILGRSWPGCAKIASTVFSCVIALLVLQAVAEQPEVHGSRMQQSQDDEAEATPSHSLWQAHRTSTFPGSNKEHARTAPAKTPFIRPIVPMPPLFATDDLLRMPWSSFGFHRTPVRFHSQPVATFRRDSVKPWAELRAAPSSSIFSADPLSSPERLASERAMPTLARSSGAAPEPLSSNPMLPTGISRVRATQIQAALVHYGYLTGAPTGSWDAPSVAAMRKLQSDHHWQTKFMPDARALTLIGLGPGSETP